MEEKTLQETQQDVNQNTNNNNVEQTKKEVSETDLSHEKTLGTIANVILFFGVLFTLICTFVLAFPTNNHGKLVFNPNGLGTTLTILFSSIISWALMRVFADISTSLKEIKKAITAPIITEVMAKIVTNTKEINEKIK